MRRVFAGVVGWPPRPRVEMAFSLMGDGVGLDGGAFSMKKLASAPTVRSPPRILCTRPTATSPRHLEPAAGVEVGPGGVRMRASRSVKHAL